MGHAYGLDRIFDRRAAVKRRAKGDLVLLRRQEIIQFLVETKLGKANFSGMVVSSCHDSLTADIRQIALSVNANDPNQIFLSKNGKSLAAAFFYFNGWAST